MYDTPLTLAPNRARINSLNQQGRNLETDRQNNELTLSRARLLSDLRQELAVQQKDPRPLGTSALDCEKIDLQRPAPCSPATPSKPMVAFTTPASSLRRGGSGLHSFLLTLPFTFTFTFRAFIRHFHPKQLSLSPFVRRKRNDNISLWVQ